MFNSIRRYFGGRDSNGLTKSDHVIITHYASLGQRVNAIRYIQRQKGMKVILAKRIVDKISPKDLVPLES